MGELVKKYTRFNGRADKKEFWSLFIFFSVLAFIFGFLSGYFHLSQNNNFILKLIFGSIIALPVIATSIRRLHDVNRSGVWFLIGAIPIIGWVILFTLLSSESFPEANKFGPPLNSGGENSTIHAAGQKIIDNARAEGKSNEEIQLELISFGWSKSEASLAVYGAPNTSTSYVDANQKSITIQKPMVAVSLLIILITLIFGFISFSKKESVSQLTRDVDMLCAFNIGMSLANGYTAEKEKMQKKFYAILNKYNLSYADFGKEFRNLESRTDNNQEYRKKIILLMQETCQI
jgi:uncharacterized membrane protein YhaH (DUF805 family)